MLEYGATDLKMYYLNVGVKLCLSFKSHSKECSLEKKCRANDIIYKCITSATGFPNKVYLGTAQREFQNQFCNHNISFKSESKTSTPPSQNTFEI